MKIRASCLALALLLASAALSSALPKLPKHLVRAVDKTGANTPLQEKAPDYFSWQTALVSPDGKFVARFTTGEGEQGFLTVYRRAGKQNVWAKRYAVSRTFEEVESCLWVPNQRHRLLVGTYGDSQVSYLALWMGANQTHYLRRGLKNKADGLNIWGTSPDGRVLYYEHYGEGTADPNYRRDTVLKMTLPK